MKDQENLKKANATQQNAEPMESKENVVPKKLVAIIPNEDGPLDILFQDVTWDEAFILIEKARVKMRKEYEKYLQEANL